ncbi:hypothetical protein PanWU01x14_330890 [Parasponia andersonii]|uniref:Uncharacterized protein n=1 Tax=Parasponia andersonii TaxID=3476 RepID=A0A2P5AHW0_PARAD|nr:hypothetical protein PanWU01x14_330890 [Parasponia andersonii]
MHNMASKLLQTFKLWHNFLRILPGRHDEPPAQVLDDISAAGRRGLDSPQTERLIVLSGLHCLIELRFDVEVAGVGFQVFDELVLCRIFGEVFGKWEVGELAELFREVKFETVVGSLLPKRGNAVCSFEDYEGNALSFEAGCHG